MKEYLTKIKAFNITSHLNISILYGPSTFSKKINNNLSEFYFKQSSLVAFKVKRKDKGKRALNMLYIIKTVSPGVKAELIPYITPGANLLLKAYGMREVKKVEDELSRAGGLVAFTEKDIKYLDIKLRRLSNKKPKRKY